VRADLRFFDRRNEGLPVYLKRFGQWIAAVFHRWRAIWAVVGIALAMSDRVADYLLLPISSVLRSQALAILGYVSIIVAVFLAWKDERDHIEDVEYRPLLSAVAVAVQEYAGGFDLAIQLLCSVGEILVAEAVVYVNFGGRFNALPAPVTIQIGHLTIGQQYSLSPPRMQFPGGFAEMRQIEGKNFDFHCELALRYTSVRTHVRYVNDELITYNTARRQFDIRRHNPPRALPTAKAAKLRRLANSIRSWLGAIKNTDG
jgi:hypothetical protein